MCLDRVDGIYKGDGNIIRRGFKVFRATRTQEGEIDLIPAYTPVSRRLAIEVWLDEKRYRIDKWREYINDGLVRYPTGWHIYPKRADAEKLAEWLNSNDYGVILDRNWFVVRAVYCRGLLATGIEDDAEVEVYRFIRIEGGGEEGYD